VYVLSAHYIALLQSSLTPKILMRKTISQKKYMSQCAPKKSKLRVDAILMLIYELFNLSNNEISHLIAKPRLGVTQQSKMWENSVDFVNPKRILTSL
jgi:hypothetical protein